MKYPEPLKIVSRFFFFLKAFKFFFPALICFALCFFKQKFAKTQKEKKNKSLDNPPKEQKENNAVQIWQAVPV